MAKRSSKTLAKSESEAAKSAVRVTEGNRAKVASTLSSLVWGSLCVLTFSQLFTPPEAVLNGDLIYIQGVWLACLALILGISWRRTALKIQWDGIDLAVGLISLAPSLSFLVMMSSGGNLRQGFYHIVSWWMTGSVVLVARRVAPIQSWRFPVALLLGSAVVASGLGIYQNQYFYRSVSEQVVPLIERYEALLNEASSRESAPSRKQVELERELTQMGIPLESQGRAMFMQRLRDSREPFGFFALANSFAAFLSVGLVLLLGTIGRLWSKDWKANKISLAILGIAGSMIAFCFLAAKSRTALAGVGVASLGLLASALWHAGPRARFIIRGAGGAAAIFGLLAVIAFAMGVVDREVLTESGKSLRYRFQYWGSSWDMLLDHPMFGVGPGNFRQHYLGYKLAESSEEILDPHNLWLDAWSNGGLVALVGIVLLLVLVGIRRSRFVPKEEADTTEHGWGPILSGVVGGACVLVAGILVPPESGRFLEETLFWGLCVGVATGVMSIVVRPLQFDGTILFWSAVAIFVHLHGSGGYSMPILSQLMLLLMVGPLAVKSSEAGSTDSNYVTPATAAVVFLMLLATIYCGWFPRQAETTAEMGLASSRSMSRSKSMLETWAEADSWSPDPWRQQSSLVLASGGKNPSETQLKQAIELMNHALERDPLSQLLASKRAEIALELWQKSGKLEDLEMAKEYNTFAIDLYPTDPPSWLLAAQIEAAKKDEKLVREAIERLEQLEAINQREGHSDRLLTPPERSILENLKKDWGLAPTTSAENRSLN